MTRRLTALALPLCLAAALVTGCGSDDNDKSSTSNPALTSPSGAAATTPSTTIKSGAPSSPAAIQACKDSLKANKGISEEIRKDLEDICDKAGRGDVVAAREASRKVCKKVIEASLPAGAARDKALKSCVLNK